jgi:hypothetical protein
MARISQGITSASFQPPDYAQDDLEDARGYRGAVGVHVETNDGGVKEQTRSLPKGKGLETSPLTTPRHRAKPYSPSQRPGRPGRVRSGR